MRFLDFIASQGSPSGRITINGYWKGDKKDRPMSCFNNSKSVERTVYAVLSYRPMGKDTLELTQKA